MIKDGTYYATVWLGRGKRGKRNQSNVPFFSLTWFTGPSSSTSGHVSCVRPFTQHPVPSPITHFIHVRLSSEVSHSPPDFRSDCQLSVSFS